MEYRLKLFTNFQIHNLRFSLLIALMETLCIFFGLAAILRKGWSNLYGHLHYLVGIAKIQRTTQNMTNKIRFIMHCAFTILCPHEEKLLMLGSYTRLGKYDRYIFLYTFYVFGSPSIHFGILPFGSSILQPSRRS